MEQKRNYGIDLLRNVSMFMIILLHSLGHGGVLKNVEITSDQYKIAWLMETGAYCAVNCYALISGFVGLQSRHKLTGFVLLWLQVVFYNVIFTLLDVILQARPITLGLIWSAFTPVTSGAYWYFTAYAGMFFFLPMINRAIAQTPKREFEMMLIGIFILFCVCPIVVRVDVFKVNAGYHALWLLILYIIGAYVKKYNPLEKWTKGACAAAYLGMVLLSWGVLLLNNHLKGTFPNTGNYLINLIQYISPTILLAAVFLLIFFSKMRIPEAFGKVIARLSPLTFGVYLIHDSIYVRKNIISGFLSGIVTDNGGVIALKVIVFACIVFGTCLLIDYIRSVIFKVLHVRALLEFVENKLRPN